MKFEKKLKEALIIDRPNRFIMNVLVDNRIETCHCPSTGRVGNILMKNIPCLISNADGNLKKRKTKYTVEAISLNKIEDKHKKWIGINQTKANSYIEYLIRSNQLPKMIDFKDKDKLMREQNIGKSRLDFVINENIYLEVKTPLVNLPLKKEYMTNKEISSTENTKFYSFDRFFKHLDELINHKKAILISFYMFEANKFIPKRKTDSNIIMDKVCNAKNSGLEFWQVNTKFNENGIELADYYKMEF